MTAATEMQAALARWEPEPPPPPIPAPEIRARLVEDPQDLPKGALSVVGKAETQGFEVTATYSRGPRLDAHWKVIEVSDSYVVRGMHPDGRRFSAAWVSKTGQRGKKAGISEVKFEFAYCHRIAGRCNATTLSTYLVTPH